MHKSNVLGTRHPKDTPKDMRWGSDGRERQLCALEQWGKWLRVLGKRGTRCCSNSEDPELGQEALGRL